MQILHTVRYFRETHLSPNQRKIQHKIQHHLPKFQPDLLSNLQNMWVTVCRPNQTQTSPTPTRTHLQHQKCSQQNSETQNKSPCGPTLCKNGPQGTEWLSGTCTELHLFSSRHQNSSTKKTKVWKEMDTYLEMSSTTRSQHDGLTSHHHPLPIREHSRLYNLY